VALRLYRSVGLCSHYAADLPPILTDGRGEASVILPRRLLQPGTGYDLVATVPGHWLAYPFIVGDTAVPSGSRAAGPVPGEDAAQCAAVAIRSPGGCVNVRREPSLSAPIVGCLPDGTRGNLFGGPAPADGHDWFIFYTQSGLPGGWVAADFLVRR
jgi:hypothetical protein